MPPSRPGENDSTSVSQGKSGDEWLILVTDDSEEEKELQEQVEEKLESPRERERSKGEPGAKRPRVDLSRPVYMTPSRDAVEPGEEEAPGKVERVSKELESAEEKVNAKQEDAEGEARDKAKFPEGKCEGEEEPPKSDVKDIIGEVIKDEDKAEVA